MTQIVKSTPKCDRCGGMTEGMRGYEHQTGFGTIALRVGKDRECLRYERWIPGGIDHSDSARADICEKCIEDFWKFWDASYVRRKS